MEDVLQRGAARLVSLGEDDPLPHPALALVPPQQPLALHLPGHRLRTLLILRREVERLQRLSTLSFINNQRFFKVNILLVIYTHIYE